MVRKIGRAQRVIPPVPFNYSEVQSLVDGIAPSDLQQKFMVWKSTEYLSIKHVEDVLISGKNNDLSVHQKELKKRYFDWLVSIESDKFRVLESVQLPINLVSNHRDDEEGHEEEQQPEVQKMPEMYQ